MVESAILYYILGLFLGYGLIFWRYNKEIEIRFKWMRKKLKKGKWKFPLAIFVTFNISMSLTNLIFSASKEHYMKPTMFGFGFFYLLFFTIFLFKYFYEIIGGKRKWKI